MSIFFLHLFEQHSRFPVLLEAVQLWSPRRFKEGFSTQQGEVLKKFFSPHEFELGIEYTFDNFAITRISDVHISLEKKVCNEIEPVNNNNSGQSTPTKSTPIPNKTDPSIGGSFPIPINSKAGTNPTETFHAPYDSRKTTWLENTTVMFVSVDI
jgi:hypothetical protein